MRYDGETILTMARLFEWHFPWQGDDFHFPDYREVNTYIMEMTRCFERDHAGTDWSSADFLDAASDYVLAHANHHPMAWRTR